MKLQGSLYFQRKRPLKPEELLVHGITAQRQIRCYCIHLDRDRQTQQRRSASMADMGA